MCVYYVIIKTLFYNYIVTSLKNTNYIVLHCPCYYYFLAAMTEELSFTNCTNKLKISNDGSLHKMPITAAAADDYTLTVIWWVLHERCNVIWVHDNPFKLLHILRIGRPSVALAVWAGKTYFFLQGITLMNDNLTCKITKWKLFFLYKIYKQTDK